MLSPSIRCRDSIPSTIVHRALLSSPVNLERDCSVGYFLSHSAGQTESTFSSGSFRCSKRKRGIVRRVFLLPLDREILLSLPSSFLLFPTLIIARGLSDIVLWSFSGTLPFHLTSILSPKSIAVSNASCILFGIANPILSGGDSVFNFGGCGGGNGRGGGGGGEGAGFWNFLSPTAIAKDDDPQQD